MNKFRAGATAPSRDSCPPRSVKQMECGLSGRRKRGIALSRRDNHHCRTACGGGRNQIPLRKKRFTSGTISAFTQACPARRNRVSRVHYTCSSHPTQPWLNTNSNTSGSTATRPWPTSAARRKSRNSPQSRSSPNSLFGGLTAAAPSRPKAAVPTVCSSRSRFIPTVRARTACW